MHNKARFPNMLFGTSLRPDSAALAIMVLLLFLIFVFLFLTLIAQPAQAQTYRVIYNFTGGQDGADPRAGLTIDRAGNLYGTAYGTAYLGAGAGTVYQLKRNGSSWTFNSLYSFTGGSDGGNPLARVILGPYGALYGTTPFGGNPSCHDPLGCGTVFKLRPSPTACKTLPCPWTETVLHTFLGSDDGSTPGFGDLLFDQTGNIYGTTSGGGAYGGGTVYELTPSGGGWTESVLYSFGGGSDGNTPWGGVILDNAGNLYGTTGAGGLSNAGTVFQLVHSMRWTENILRSFAYGSDGGDHPFAGLIIDQSGNLYGATQEGGSGSGGTVFELSPSGGGWTFSLLYSIRGGGINCGPSGSLVMDGAGNLYGTTVCDGRYGYGSVFKLTPSRPYWTYTSLHDFCAGGPPCSDGTGPISNVVFDANGNLYGTAEAGGSGTACQGGCGIVWEITP
jgi:uncharacterized repeat protein (TIGR03803 family)